MITNEVRENLKNELLVKSLESAKKLGRIPSMHSLIIGVLECQACCSTDDFAELGFAEAVSVIYDVRNELHIKYGFDYTLTE